MCDALLELAREELGEKIKEEIRAELKEKLKEELEEKLKVEFEEKLKEELEEKLKVELEEKIKVEFEEGKEFGRQAEKNSIVTKMREKGLSVGQIAELTGLSENEVEGLLKGRDK